MFSESAYVAISLSLADFTAFLQDVNQDRIPAATCPFKVHMLIVQLMRQITIELEVCLL